MEQPLYIQYTRIWYCLQSLYPRTDSWRFFILILLHGNVLLFNDPSFSRTGKSVPRRDTLRTFAGIFRRIAWRTALGEKGEEGGRRFRLRSSGPEPRGIGLAPWIVMPPRTASAQRPIPAPQRWFSFPKWGERHRPGNFVTWGKNLSPCPPAQNRAILEERAVISGTAAKNGLRERTNFSRARKTRSERERPLAQKYRSNTL